MKASKIEQCLRRIVYDARKNNEDGLTVKLARSRAEKQLKLDDGFLKSEEWRQRSKNVVEAAFEEELESPDVPDHNSSHTKGPSSEPSAKEMPNGNSKGLESSRKPAKTSEVPLQNGNNGGSSSSEEEDQDSGSGVEKPATQSETQPSKPSSTPAKVNGVKRKAKEKDSSQEESGEESGSEEASDQPAQKRAKVDSSGSSESNSTESSEDESGSSDEEDEKEESSLLSKTKAKGTLSDKTGKAIPPKPFTPPSGYTLLAPAHLAESSPLTSANLAGKQVWHITAPSNISLASLTEVAFDVIQSGQPVLTHNGIEYALNEDQTLNHGMTALFAPTKEGYERVDQKVTRTLQLQQKLILPNLTSKHSSQASGSTAAGDIAQACVTSVRPQPKGLRMRYKPPGCGSGRPGRIGSGSDSSEEDQDDEDPAPRQAFQFPKALGAHATNTQQTSDDTAANETVANETSSEEMVSKTTVLDETRSKESTNEQNSAKKSKKKRKDTGDAVGAKAEANGVPETSANMSPHASEVTPRKGTSKNITMTEDAADTQSSAKKLKKKHKSGIADSKSGTDGVGKAAAESSLATNTSAQGQIETTNKNKLTKGLSAEILGNSAPGTANGAAAPTSAKDDEAKRKEEKRLRKERKEAKRAKAGAV